MTQRSDFPASPGHRFAAMRGLVPLVCAAWAVLGLLRAMMWWATTHRPFIGFLRRLAIDWSIVLLWVAFTPVIAELTRRFGWRRGTRLRAAALHILAVVAFNAVEAAWTRVAVLSEPGRFIDTYVSHFDTNLLTYLAVVGMVCAWDYRRRLVERDHRATRLEQRLTEARLKVLLLQLQPHFLFNTLHAISELVYRNAAAARRMVSHLRHLLEWSAERGTRQEVPLRQELRFLEAYLEIQRVRFDERLVIEVDIADDLMDAAVPYLILQPLVENAIRHGMQPGIHPAAVLVTGRQQEDRLELSVIDSGAGGAARNAGGGLGLENTRERLQQLYGGSSSLELHRMPGAGTAAIVTIPFRVAPEEERARPVRTTTSEPPFSAPDHHDDFDVAESDIRGPAVETPASAPGLRIPSFVTIAVLWTLCGVFWTQQEVVINRLAGDPGRPWPQMVYTNFLNPWIWALLTPPIVWLARRQPRLGRWSGRGPLLTVHIAGALGTAGAMLWVRRVVGLVPQSGPVLNIASTNLMLWDLTIYGLIVGFAVAADSWRRSEVRQREIVRAEGALAQARLELLRWRLQPHFLATTLDRIADLAECEPARSDQLTTRLGEMLRLMLSNHRAQWSSLRDELALANAYLDIERLCSTAELDLNLDVSPEAWDQAVPTMLLQPLLEQALARGGQRQAEVIDLVARPNPDGLNLAIHSRPGAGEAGFLGLERGLSPIRSRLDLLYGRRARLNARTSGAGLSLTLDLPLVPA